jgi:hypothetical protein
MINVENCLKSKNPKDKLIKRCSKEFGITEDPCEGGFLLENGKFLDFSGKIDGGPSGVRSYDHREIGRCINSESCNIVQSFHKFRLIGKQGNAVRFHTSGCRSYAPIVNIILYDDQKPTDKQWEVIRKSAKENGEIVYDVLNKDGARIQSGHVSADKTGRLRMFFESLK